MDKLDNFDGYILIESLVSIIILGIVISSFVIFFNQFFSNSKILFKSEATVLAKHEIEKSHKYKITSDTVYFNEQKNLLLKREINKIDKLFKSKVTIFSTQDDSEILSLSVYYINDSKK